MKDQELVNTLREHAEWAEGNQWETPITLCDDLTKAANLIEAQAKEIEKLRGQVPRWIPVEERLPELQSWGASTLVLGIVQNESGYPPPNPCFCVYLGNQKWRIRGRMATITHWMPLPEPPEEVE